MWSDHDHAFSNNFTIFSPKIYIDYITRELHGCNYVCIAVTTGAWIKPAMHQQYQYIYRYIISCFLCMRSLGNMRNMRVAWLAFLLFDCG